MVENSFENPEKYHSFLREMSNACDEILDPSKVNSLVYTFLEIIRHDSSINKTCCLTYQVLFFR